MTEEQKEKRRRAYKRDHERERYAKMSDAERKEGANTGASAMPICRRRSGHAVAILSGNPGPSAGVKPI
jgi:hypothetical protein